MFSVTIFLLSKILLEPLNYLGALILLRYKQRKADYFQRTALQSLNFSRTQFVLNQEKCLQRVPFTNLCLKQRFSGAGSLARYCPSGQGLLETSYLQSKAPESCFSASQVTLLSGHLQITTHNTGTVHTAFSARHQERKNLQPSLGELQNKLTIPWPRK